ncbi:DUF6283 family protein [Azohydromonas australica]|uniref:DUF6283 family protein n=1 Tax=Azohydromonas australica TaxID=364039 RepID=UPI00217568F0|nr:DUF6283 family protein [Azohydromonas australica]
MKALSSPCPSCPWRKGSSADEIPNFSMPLAEKLRATCPNERGMGPGMDATWFACHQSKDGAEIPCAGWLAKVGNAHPRVRLAVMEGRLDPEVLTPGQDWPALYDTYPQVMEQLYATCSGDMNAVGASCPHEQQRDLDDAQDAGSSQDEAR